MSVLTCMHNYETRREKMNFSDKVFFRYVHVYYNGSVLLNARKQRMLYIPVIIFSHFSV